MLQESKGLALCLLSTIGFPKYFCNIKRLERVPKKFVKYLLFTHHFPSLDGYKLYYKTLALASLISQVPSYRHIIVFSDVFSLQAIVWNHLMWWIAWTNTVPCSKPSRVTKHGQLFFKHTQVKLQTNCLCQYNYL